MSIASDIVQSGTQASAGQPLSALEQLYRHLGYTGPLGGPAHAGSRSAHESLATATPDLETETGPGEPPPLDPLSIEVIKERLRSEPDEVLQRARALWDAELSLEELEDAVQRASRIVSAPELALQGFEAGAAFERATVQLPPEFFQDWPFDPNIPINPASTKFETKADAANWVLFSGPALIGSQFGTKAPFEWHHRHASSFVYPRPAPTDDAPLKIGLVSDFGTGLYHSRYIAKQLKDRKYPYVIHGGDVYYAGRDSEFATNFRPQIDPLLDRAQVFTMNANHEMYSLGKPYFAYIKDRKRRHPEQLQQGSYFCLRFGTTLQIVGIDTAYFRNGRLDDTSLQSWLRQVLQQGRGLGTVNVLFSPNEPYSYGSTGLTSLLTKDLDDIVLDKKLVDLWFWGNTHYCALFDRTSSLPFVGSCIGHGGYPYSRMKTGRSSAAPVRFLETGARFPAWTQVRQDRGNNGFCELTIHRNRSVDLHYIDWMGRSRCTAHLAPVNGTMMLTAVNG